MSDKLIMVELGCGKTKSPGYIGVDRFALPGVDIVSDLNETFPFEDNSVDVIFACHSLEHLDDIGHVMNEIYRICKHGAIVQILSPYYLASLNLANYFHKLKFSEDTMRLFSNEPTTMIDKEQYYCPHSDIWGVEQSDNSTGEVELTILNMEYFYYKEYCRMSEEEKLHARRSLVNVCDQIFYLLVANKEKEPFSEKQLLEFKDYAKQFEPPVLSALRNRDSYQAQFQYPGILTDMTAPIKEDISKVQLEITNHKERLEQQIGQIDQLKIDVLENIREIRETRQITLQQIEYFNQQQTESLEQQAKLLEQQAELLEQQRKFSKQQNQKLQEQNIELGRKMQQQYDSLSDKTKENFQKEEEKLYQLSQRLISYEARRNDIIYSWDAKFIQMQTKLDYQASLLSIVSQELEQQTASGFLGIQKKVNLYPQLLTEKRSFIDSLVLADQLPKGKFILTWSKRIPAYSYFEYKLSGYGEQFCFYLQANKGASLFLEIVMNEKIIKQETIQIQENGLISIPVMVMSKGSVRLKACNSSDFIKVLEVRTFWSALLRRNQLAYYVK